jgi:hypothetical protein
VVYRSVLSGFHGTLACLHAPLLLYGCSAAFSGVLAVMFGGMLSSSFGDSRAAVAFLSGFDASIATDLRRMHPDALPTFLLMIGLISPFYIILNTFLTGGVIFALQHTAIRPGVAAFFVASRRYVSRLLRLFLLTGTIGLLSGALILLIGGLLVGPIYESAASEQSLYLLASAVGIALITMLSILTMIADYAKIGLVFNDGGSAVQAFGESLLFVLRHARVTLALQALLMLLFLGFLLTQLSLWAPLTMDSIASILIVVVVHQFFVLVRVTFRVLWFGAELSLYEKLLPSQTPDALEEDVHPTTYHHGTTKTEEAHP